MEERAETALARQDTQKNAIVYETDGRLGSNNVMALMLPTQACLRHCKNAIAQSLPGKSGVRCFISGPHLESMLQ